MQKIDTLLK